MIEAGCVDSGCELREKLDVITMPGHLLAAVVCT